MGVLESLGKVLDFLSVKEWEPCGSNCSLDCDQPVKQQLEAAAAAAAAAVVVVFVICYNKPN